MIKAVLDTNVLVSAIISPKGSPAKIISFWRQRKFILIVSQEILVELASVLGYKKILEKYHLDKKKIEKYLRLFKAFASIYKTREKVDILKEDPCDNKFLEVALASRADFIVSGDKHLLDLGKYQGVEILTAREFLKELEKSYEIDEIKPVKP